eukprot:TRINITY_DN2592_c0_g2_i3.p5 TRINITY_DN2592_c0_g2~~TRINITY_DN2592_c0_g2_i3.p5  ORF type:complete len:104 (-),score=12.99 TRINITY_DN2592_c0_g2_i3:303-614(-)
MNMKVTDKLFWMNCNNGWMGFMLKKQCWIKRKKDIALFRIGQEMIDVKLVENAYQTIWDEHESYRQIVLDELQQRLDGVYVEKIVLDQEEEGYSIIQDWIRND